MLQNSLLFEHAAKEQEAISYSFSTEMLLYKMQKVDMGHEAMV